MTGGAQTVVSRSAEGITRSYSSEIFDDGSLARSVVAAYGTVTTSTQTADGTASSQDSDGTTTSSASSPDPRYGMQAQVGSQLVATPDGRQLSFFTSRSVTTTGGTNPVLTTFTETADVAGNDSTSVFDVASRTWTTTSAAGRTATATLDARGKLAFSSLPGLTPIQYTYDGIGRLTNIAQGVRNVGFAYDSANRLTSVTDPLGRTVHFAYDLADRVVEQTLNDGRVIGFTYDANGNLTSLTPPSRPAHGFTFTPVDLLASYAPPPVTPGGATLYSYNRDRQLTRVDRPDGRSVLLSYDTAGRPATLAIGRGSFQYGWDDATGHLTSITAPDGGEISYDYDGALPTDATWEGEVSGSISWDYDSRFNVQTETVNCATSTNLACQIAYFGYDPDGLLSIAGPLYLDYDPSNGLLTDTQVGAVTDLWSYNDFGEPTAYTASVNGAPVFSEQFTRDALGRITVKNETAGGTTTTFGYGYDDSGRLTDVTTNGTSTAHYTYDENGNRLTRVTPAGTESATVDAQDRLLTYADATYTYTANGELATKTDATGTTTYDYDELGNLLGVTLPTGHRIDYVIDAQNRRVGKKVDGVLVQRFVYGTALGPAAELDANGDVVARFIYATHVNVPDVIIKGDTTYRVITDQVGSPRLVVNSDSGEIVESVEYDEFGRLLSGTSPGFQPFGFAGGLYDVDTGLTRFGARDYEPQRGRWTSKDTIRMRGGDANLYSYVLDDPVNLYDSNGQLFAVAEVVGAAIGGAVNSAAYATAQLIKYHGNFHCISGRDLAVAFGVGFAAGFFATDTLGASIAVAAGANTVQYAAIQTVHGRTVTASGLAANAVSGALGGAVSTGLKAAEANTIENIARGPDRYTTGTNGIDKAVDSAPRGVVGGYVANVDPDCGRR